jgi:hypothetical protein
MTSELYSRNWLPASLALGALILVAAFMPLLLLPLLFVLTLSFCDTSSRAPALALAPTRRGSPRSRLDRGPPSD